jgi:hypothetical protein
VEYSENAVPYETARMILLLGGGVKGCYRDGSTIHLWGAGEIPCLDFFHQLNLDGRVPHMYFWVITTLKNM